MIWRAQRPLWIVRDLADADVPAAKRLLARAFPGSDLEAGLADELGRSDVVWLALDEPASGEIVGAASLRWLLDEAHFTAVVVRQDLRGRGLGARLLRALLVAADEGNASSVTLEVRESNAVARSLYARFGFDEVGRRRDYYTTDGVREDAVLMTTPPLHDPAWRQVAGLPRR